MTSRSLEIWRALTSLTGRRGTATAWPTVPREGSASIWQGPGWGWPTTPAGLELVTSQQSGFRGYRWVISLTLHSVTSHPLVSPLCTNKTLQDNQIIYAKCGGYCGTCEPEHYKGLKLDVLPYWTLNSLSYCAGCICIQINCCIESPIIVISLCNFRMIFYSLS